MNDETNGTVNIDGGTVNGPVIGQNTGNVAANNQITGDQTQITQEVKGSDGSHLENIFQIGQQINNPLPPPPLPAPPDDTAIQAARDLLATLPTADAAPLPAADGATLPRPHRMELPANPNFVGRETELRDLARALKHGATAAITPTAATTGVGGVGKTNLATEFVYRYGRFFAGGVFWLSFAGDTKSSVQAEIAACGMPDCMNLYTTENLKPEDQVRYVLATWKWPIPRLLVFDNCEDPQLAHHWLKQIIGSGCRVLITSRHTTWNRNTITCVPLETLPRPDSMTLLQTLCPGLSDADADAVAHELGDLPLALHLAGSYLHEYTPSLQTYLAALRDPHLLDHFAFTELDIDDLPTGHIRSVARTFELSYERLKTTSEVDALALRLLAHAACFAPGEPLPRDLLTATLDDDTSADECIRALRRLRNLGLLEGDDPCKLHRLIAAFVQQRTPDPDAHAAVEQTLNSLVYKVLVAGVPAPLLPLRAHLSYVTDRALQRGDERAATLANNFASHLEKVGDYGAARPLYERALAIREQQLGPDHPDTASSLNNLALLLDSIGDYAAARPLYERALAIREQQLGPHHPNVAASLNNLAALLKSQGDYAAARPLYERALAIREQQLGPDHPDVATSLNNLAALYYAQGDYDTARPLMERALAIWEQRLGPSHPDTASSLNNLALLLDSIGDYAAARPLMERALAIWEQRLGPSHPDTASSLNNLALLLDSIGDYAAARPLYERALAIREQQLGADHPDTATSLNNLAELLRAQGDDAAARPLYERALAIREQQLGPSHPATAQSLNNLAILHYYEGDVAGGIPLMQRAIAIRMRVLGPQHPDTQGSIRSLAAMMQAAGGQPRSAEEQIAAITQQAEAAVAQALAQGNDEQRTALAQQLESLAQQAAEGEEEGSPWLALAARLRALAGMLMNDA